MFRYILFLALLLPISCTQELDMVLEESIKEGRIFPNVDEQLHPYFAQFEIEGEMRGWDIDLTQANITGKIERIIEDEVAGICRYGHRLNPREIVIDSEFWQSASEEYREYIIFHELGHCYLFRDHDDTCLIDGIWSSIMRSGTVTGCRDFYNGRTRRYYINELFTINM